MRYLNAAEGQVIAHNQSLPKGMRHALLVQAKTDRVLGRRSWRKAYESNSDPCWKQHPGILIKANVLDDFGS